MSEENNTPEWAAGLPEALHGMPYLNDAATAEDFVTQVSNAAAHMGNSLRLPGPDAGAEDIAGFQAKVMEKVPGLMTVPDIADEDAVKGIMTRLGRPDTPEQYKLPDGVDMDVDTLGKLKAQAHKVNMTQAQFDAQVSAMAAERTQAADTMARQIETDRQALKEEWGYAFADRMGEIGGFLKASKDTPAAILTAFNEDRMDAASLRWLYRVSQLGDETGQSRVQEDGSQSTLAPAEALAQLEEVENRLFHGNNGRQMTPADPAYANLVAKRMELMKQAYPEGSAA